MVSPNDHVIMNHQNQTRTNGIWGHVRYKYTRFTFGWVISGHDFSGPRLRSLSFRFLHIYLIASLLSVHCVSPYRRSHIPRRISTLKTKYHLLWLAPWPQPIVVHGSSIQGRSQDGAMIEDFKYLSEGKIFPVPTLSLSPLCPKTSKRLSMGEEVGTMQFLSSKGSK
jgi:hypothetical protein